MDLSEGHGQSNAVDGAAAAQGAEDEWVSPLFRDLFEDDLNPFLLGQSPHPGLIQPEMNGSSLQNHLSTVCDPPLETNIGDLPGDQSIFDIAFVDVEKKEELETGISEAIDVTNHVEHVGVVNTSQLLLPGSEQRPDLGENHLASTHQANLEATTAGESKPSCGKENSPQQTENSFAQPLLEKAPSLPFVFDSPDSLSEILNFRQLVGCPPGDLNLPPPAYPHRDADLELRAPFKEEALLHVPQSPPRSGSLVSPNSDQADTETPAAYKEAVVSKAMRLQTHKEQYGCLSLPTGITEGKHSHESKKCMEAPAPDIFEVHSCPQDTVAAYSSCQFLWGNDVPALCRASSPTRNAEHLPPEVGRLPIGTFALSTLPGGARGLNAVEAPMTETTPLFQHDVHNSQELVTPASIPPAYPSVPGAQPLPPHTSVSGLSLPRRRKKKTRSKARKWTADEQARFEFALETWGRDWEACARHVGTRDISLIRSHAQKHFIKLYKTGQPLPLRVADSGPGYTLSGNVLRDDSPSARSYLTGINAPVTTAVPPKHSPPCNDCVGRADSSHLRLRGSALAPLDTNVQPGGHHGCGSR